MTSHLDQLGAKTLAVGLTITVPSMVGGITTGVDRPRSVLALIPTVPQGPSDSFAFLREVTREHAAATVKMGALKPTSTYSVEKCEDRVRTIATAPDDWEAIELSTSDMPFVLSDASGQSSNRLPIDRANRRLWGYPVIVTAALEAGQSIFGDWTGSIEVHLREYATVEVSEAPQVLLDSSASTTASAFELNMRVLRCEMRAGVAVKRPAAFVVIALAAES